MAKTRGQKNNTSLKKWLESPQFKEIVIKSKKVKGLSVSLNWDCGEGHNGDYNEEDPNDMPLLRFDISYEPKKGWHYDLQDASYCTNLTVLDNRDLLTKAVEHILMEAENTFKYDVANDEAKVGKRIMEGLSWMRIENGKVV